MGENLFCGFKKNIVEKLIEIYLIEILKNSSFMCHTPYFRNSIAYDHIFGTFVLNFWVFQSSQ